MNTNRQWLLAKRPHGTVGKENFEYSENPIPQPGDGEVLVRNLFLSFDPTQRGWMEDRESYLPPGRRKRQDSSSRSTLGHHRQVRLGPEAYLRAAVRGCKLVGPIEANGMKLRL